MESLSQGQATGRPGAHRGFLFAHLRLRTSWFSWYVHTANGPNRNHCSCSADMESVSPRSHFTSFSGKFSHFYPVFQRFIFRAMPRLRMIALKKKSQCSTRAFHSKPKCGWVIQTTTKKVIPRQTCPRKRRVFGLQRHMREWRIRTYILQSMIRTRMYVIKCRPLAVGPWTTYPDQTRVSLFFISMRAFNTIQYKDALQIITESSILILSVSACVTVNINLQLSLWKTLTPV